MACSAKQQPNDKGLHPHDSRAQGMSLHQPEEREARMDRKDHILLSTGSHCKNVSGLPRTQQMSLAKPQIRTLLCHLPNPGTFLSNAPGSGPLNKD